MTDPVPYTPDALKRIRAAADGGHNAAEIADALGWPLDMLVRVCCQQGIEFVPPADGDEREDDPLPASALPEAVLRPVQPSLATSAVAAVSADALRPAPLPPTVPRPRAVAVQEPDDGDAPPRPRSGRMPIRRRMMPKAELRDRYVSVAVTEADFRWIAERSASTGTPRARLIGLMLAQAIAVERRKGGGA